MNQPNEYKRYHYQWPENADRQSHSADIGFKKLDGGKWTFQSCKYYGTAPTYTLTDWQFLRDLADEIIRLQNELK